MAHIERLESECPPDAHKVIRPPENEVNATIVVKVEESEEEDVNLDEFADEIEPWIINELKRVGCDTAKSVLELSESELESRTDLEIETIRDVLKILKAEFE